MTRNKQKKKMLCVSLQYYLSFFFHSVSNCVRVWCVQRYTTIIFLFSHKFFFLPLIKWFIPQIQEFNYRWIENSSFIVPDVIYLSFFLFCLFIVSYSLNSIFFCFGEFNLIQFRIESKIHLENSKKKKNSNSLFRFNDLIQNHLIFIPFQTNHFNSCLSFSMFVVHWIHITNSRQINSLWKKSGLIWQFENWILNITFSLSLLLMGTNKQIVVKFNLNKKRNYQWFFFLLLFIDSLIRVEIGFRKKKFNYLNSTTTTTTGTMTDNFFFHFFLFCHLI